VRALWVTSRRHDVNLKWHGSFVTLWVYNTYRMHFHLGLGACTGVAGQFSQIGCDQAFVIYRLCT
jgi:hypothetical protein